MDGKQIRRAREAAGLGQIALAETAGVPRSSIQSLEVDGKVNVSTLEKVIARLPTLQVLTLGGVTFVAIDRVLGESAIRKLIEDAVGLETLMHASSPVFPREPEGAQRVTGVTGVDDAARQRAAAIDAAINRGEISDDDDS